ncbi:MAG: hypothetical protein RR346_08410 [Bacteroidales bacterium]
MGIAIGANLNYKYCMDRLVDVAVTYDDAHAECPLCESTLHTDSCCSHEQEYVKLSIDQNYTPIHPIVDVPALIDLLFNLNHHLLLRETATLTDFRCDHSLYSLYSDPLYITNCVFLI